MDGSYIFLSELFGELWTRYLESVTVSSAPGCQDGTVPTVLSGIFAALLQISVWGQHLRLEAYVAIFTTGYSNPDEFL